MRTRRDHRERDKETVRLVNAALDSDPVDTGLLRKLAAVRGLVTDQVRASAWPRLLGVDARAAPAARYTQHALERHRDSSTVQCDCDRSLWHFTPGWSEDRRAAKRAALQRLLNGVVGLHARDVFYYQGLHDIASVLLMVCGEAASYCMLERLVLFPLRDCTRATLAPVTELLQLLFPLLAQADPELHAFLRRSEVLPFFALTWVLTWHVHDVRDLPTAARLFDLFLASTPLMPMYLGVVALVAERKAVMAVPCDASEVHRFLTSLNVLGRLSADELAVRAIAMHREVPPPRLLQLAGVRPPRSGALAAYPYPFLTQRQRPERILRTLPCMPPQADAPRKQTRAGTLRAVGATVGTSAAVLGAVALLGGAGPVGYVARALLAGATA